MEWNQLGQKLNDLNDARYGLTGAGATNTAAVAFGGESPGICRSNRSYGMELTGLEQG